MKSYYRLPEGVQDMLPADCYNLNVLQKRLETKFSQAGCVAVQSAALEYYDTYAEIKNKIPQEKMFKLTDSDGSLLVLRPDMTLAVARMAATKLTDTNVKIS
ncbi:MAG: ATP phosphoribosyltransferase regulatory subunit [Clostridia bacterium]|nr:ATP phosphoribosyltransferase regulatory subunit [Clostridia bacterium]